MGGYGGSRRRERLGSCIAIRKPLGDPGPLSPQLNSGNEKHRYVSNLIDFNARIDELKLAHQRVLDELDSSKVQTHAHVQSSKQSIGLALSALHSSVKSSYAKLGAEAAARRRVRAEMLETLQSSLAQICVRFEQRLDQSQAELSASLVPQTRVLGQLEQRLQMLEVMHTQLRKAASGASDEGPGPRWRWRAVAGSSVEHLFVSAHVGGGSSRFQAVAVTKIDPTDSDGQAGAPGRPPRLRRVPPAAWGIPDTFAPPPPLPFVLPWGWACPASSAVTGSR